MLFPRNIQQVLEKFACKTEVNNFRRPKVVASTTLEVSNPAAEVEKYFKLLGDEYKEVLTSFGYFQEFHSVKSPLAFCQSMLYRGSAGYFSKTKNPGADIVLPLVFRDGQYGLLLVKVSCIQDNIIISCGDTKMTPSAVVRNAMEMCTLNGVFGFKGDKLRVLRVFINMNSSHKSGIKCFKDEHGPLLAIHSDGCIPFLYGGTENEFFRNCMKTAKDVC